MREPDKTRENRSRRAADRCGLRLVKSPRRDPNGLDFGLYALVDQRTGNAINPSLHDRFQCSWSLVQVERYLRKPRLKKATQSRDAPRQAQAR